MAAADTRNPRWTTLVERGATRGSPATNCWARLCRNHAPLVSSLCINDTSSNTRSVPAIHSRCLVKENDEAPNVSSVSVSCTRLLGGVPAISPRFAERKDESVGVSYHDLALPVGHVFGTVQDFCAPRSPLARQRVNAFHMKVRVIAAIVRFGLQ